MGSKDQKIVDQAYLDYVKRSEGYVPGAGYVHNDQFTPMYNDSVKALGDFLGNQKLVDRLGYIPDMYYKIYMANVAKAQEESRKKGFKNPAQLARTDSQLNATPMDEKWYVKNATRDFTDTYDIDYDSRKIGPPVKMKVVPYWVRKQGPGPAADALLAGSLESYGRITKDQFDRKYGSGSFDTLPLKDRQALTDLVFQGGFLKKWPKLTESIRNADYDSAKKELNINTRWGKNNRREKLFSNQFLGTKHTVK